MLFVILALSFLLVPQVGVTETYYIHPSGTDAQSCFTASAGGGCSGTAGCARRTIAGGQACMVGGGHTLVFGPGTYVDQVWSQPPSGSAGAPTRFQTLNGLGTVTIQRVSMVVDQFIFLDDDHWITFDGFIWDGDGEVTAIFANEDIGSTSNIVVTNSILRNARRGCTLTIGGPWTFDRVEVHHCGVDPDFDHGIYFSAHNSTVSNSYIHHCTAFGLQIWSSAGHSLHDNVIKNNRWTANGHGFTSAWGSGHQIVNNMMWNDAVSLDRSDYGMLVATDTTLVYNNSFFCNSLNINDNAGDPANGTVVQGNVIYCPSGGVNLRPGTGAAIVSNNLVGVNPGWANGAVGDLHVSVGSPVLDACPVLSQVTPDYDGETRNSGGGGYDCGADERSGAPAAPPATTLQFAQQPPSVVFVHQPITPALTVRVLDAVGALYTATPVSISLAKVANPGGGVLAGTLIQQSGATGVATFADLTLSNNGTGLQIEATAAELTSATSTVFSVQDFVPFPAATLVFGTQPSSTIAGQTMSPPVTVELRNINNQLVTDEVKSVTLSLQQNPAGGTLSGTLIRSTVAGVATFNNLSINIPGTGYTLRALTTGLTDPEDQSDFFAIETPPPAALTPSIKVDQFGYLPTATKVAVLSNPQTGFNATDAYTPGNPLRVKTSPGGTTVFSAAATAWNAGATHGQSGDQLWWFDFSSVTTPGEYVIADDTNGIQSDVFAISGTVYQAVLTAAQRMFYYQRSGLAKTTAFAGANWTDTAAFLGTGQDTQARSVTDQGNAGTARDLQGGWFDAGDYNKYTLDAAHPVSDLLTAYQLAPTLWSDTANLPESGNGLPDIVDEAKWGLDWLLRMQAATGDGSLLSKVSVLTTTAFSPPSADTQPRYWGAASTAATAAAAAAFAQGASVFGALGQTTYAGTLTTAAQNAWTWATANPNVDYPNTGFGTGNPDPCGHGCPYGQLMERLRAAIYLYGLTSSATYKTFVETNYTASHALEWGFWYPFERHTQDALLYYAALPGATVEVKNTIQASAVGSIAGADFVTAWTNVVDGYRAYLHDNNYTWGSNQTKAATATLYTNLIAYNLNSAQHALYRTIASAYLHYLHGVNPMGLAYLTRMGGLGAERSANEMYHSWFVDGSDWDNALTSPKGPPPGFLTGGANPQYSGTQSPPLGQPPQKSYKDWNGLGANEHSWEITEPDIAYQAAYLRLLSQVMPAATAVPTSLAFVQQPTSTVAGGTITPAVTVRVLDATGQVVPGSTLAITVGLGVNPAGGTLACGPATCTKAAVAGVVTFDTLSLATVGTGYALSATGAGVTAAQSDVFAITAAPAPPTDLSISLFSTGQFLR